MRNRAWRRAQRRRVIRRRIYIVKNVWFTHPRDWSEWPWVKNGSRFSKYNLVCSCDICRDEKYRDKPRRRS